MAASVLRHVRLDADFTLLDVQQRTGISQSRLSLIERELVAARPDEQERLARLLEREIEYLFPAVGHAGRQATRRPDEVGEPALPARNSI